MDQSWNYFASIFASVSNEAFRIFHGTHKRSKIGKVLKWQEALLLCFPC